MHRLVAVLLTVLIAACAAPPERPGVKQRYSGEAQPDAALTDAVLAATHTYWAAIADGRWREAYGFYAPVYREEHPFEEWARHRHDAWPVPPRPLSIHWSKGTYRQHGPELYAMLKWSARMTSVGSVGTLIWRQEPDGSFLLENSVTRVLIRPPRT